MTPDPESHTALHRNRRSPWTLERWLLLLTFTMTGIVFVFGVGVQWAKTTAVEAAVSALEHNTVRQDVYQADQRLLSQSIDRLTVAMDRLAERERAK